MKIRSGVGVFEAAGAVVCVVDGRIESVVFGDEWVAAPGMGDDLERALRGLPIERLALSRAAGASPRGDELVGAIVAAHQRGF